MDAEYPDMCANTQASVSAAYIYMGAHLPERYSNALFIGDYSKVSNISCALQHPTSKIPLLITINDY